jgi:mannobiose 2-epimerase
MKFPTAALLCLALLGTIRAGTGETGPTPIPPATLHSFASEADQELRGNILPFWLKHARNPERGGFHAFIGEDMRVRDDQPRGALLTSRILWTFSAAHRRHPDPAYLEMARYAYEDLTKRFVDPTHGGVIWSVNPDQTPADTRKQIYGQVFAIYGLAEYFRATGDQTALAQAISIYRLVDEHARDAVHGGYFDALDREWHRLGVNMLGPAPKTQNSHIHILEAFTNLLRVWPDGGLRERQRELIELIMHRIIDPRTNHLVLFMQDDWTPVGDEVSYGHDIELSWLLVEAAEVLGDQELLARVKTKALAMAAVTMAQGLDQDGGMYNEGTNHGPTNTNKDWWEQAEAAVGFLNAYQLSGDLRYFTQAQASWKFIQTYLVDRRQGDWHSQLRRDGSPVLEFTLPSGLKMPYAKLSTWKCPYHNSRACLELAERLEAIATRSVPGAR